jgi:hypothetical protein
MQLLRLKTVFAPFCQQIGQCRRYKQNHRFANAPHVAAQAKTALYQARRGSAATGGVGLLQAESNVSKEQ